MSGGTKITRMIIKPAATVLFLFFLSHVFGQDHGSVRGVVRDSNQPLEFATILLTSATDTLKIINTTVTDSLGAFRFDELRISNYRLVIRMLGYLHRSMTFSITADTYDVFLGEIPIKVNPDLLTAVEVEAFRTILQKTDDGFVLNASANITQIGGTAADLLRNMPGILIGSEGEITLRGRTPLTLINGRISGITGVDRSAQLERIPASSVERIEIINNPTAKYDADAEGGVINIVLKKNEAKGMNGSVAIGAGRGARYRLNGSMILNYKTDKMNLGFAYDNWYTTRTRSAAGDRVNFELPDEHFLTQRRFDERLIFYQNTRTTIDYSISKTSDINFEALWAFPGEDNNETLKNTYETSDKQFNSANTRHSNEIRRSHALEFALRYLKRLRAPGTSLAINVTNASGNDKEDTGITTQGLTDNNQHSGGEYLQRTHTYQKTNLANVAVDFSKAAGSNYSFEAGLKSIFRHLNSDFGRSNFVEPGFEVDPLNTNIFEFEEQIHAVYSQYTGWTGRSESPKWKYSFGLRAEAVRNEGQTKTMTTAFVNDYFNLFPSANLFFYARGENNFKLSYSRRINRPGLGQLNPFIDITDSLNQGGGNPGLKPELIHSVELGYYQSSQKASLSIVPFYRIRNNAILRYTILDENGVAFTQPLNFGRASTLGAEVITTVNLCSWWDLNFSVSAYESSIEDRGAVGNLSRDQLNWYSKLINNFTVLKNGRLQVIGSYTSPFTIPQGESVPVYFVDLGFQQTIMRGKGRIGVTATDIFNSQKYGFITSDYNFDFSRVFKQDTQAIMVTFGYAFRSAFKEEKLMENKFKND
jgi:outer membrane receptor protein involved in Fe transport